MLGFTDLVPPWPGRGAATAVAVICCMLGIIAGFLVHPKERKAQRYLGIICIATAFILLLAYLHLLSVRVYPYEQIINHEHFVRRIVVGTDVRYPQDRVKTKVELLELYGLDASAWTETSLSRARLCLISSYGLLYFVLCFGLGVLQSHSARVSPKP